MNTKNENQKLSLIEVMIRSQVNCVSFFYGNEKRLSWKLTLAFNLNRGISSQN